MASPFPEPVFAEYPRGGKSPTRQVNFLSSKRLPPRPPHITCMCTLHSTIKRYSVLFSTLLVPATFDERTTRKYPIFYFVIPTTYDSRNKLSCTIGALLTHFRAILGSTLLQGFFFNSLWFRRQELYFFSLTLLFVTSIIMLVQEASCTSRHTSVGLTERCGWASCLLCHMESSRRPYVVSFVSLA